MERHFCSFDCDPDIPLYIRFFYKPGATVHGVSLEDYFVKQCVTWNPDIIVILLGGNDVKVNWPITETFNLYKIFCCALKARLPQTHFICCTIEPRFAPASVRHNTPPPDQYKVAAHKFNRLLKRWKIPDHRFLTWGSNRLENSSLFKADLVHLNEQGNKVYFELLYELLCKAAKDNFLK